MLAFAVSSNMKHAILFQQVGSVSVCPKLLFQVCPVCVSFMCGFLLHFDMQFHFYYYSWLLILHLYHQGSSKVPCFSFHHFTIYKNGASEWARVFLIMCNIYQLILNQFILRMKMLCIFSFVFLSHFL